ncbi:MAG: TonB family protein [Gammaproteobacteria bacterium]|nr:TonB family protein [Gammaproteobacteria bacterium]
MHALPRNLLALLFAMLITAALFYAMQRMLSSDPQRFDSLQDVNVIQFIPYQPREELPPEKPQQLPEPPKPLQPPKTPPIEAMTPSTPSVAAPALQKLDINLPLQMSGTPFIGIAAPSAELGEAIPLVRIPPNYPIAAKRRKLSGKVIVEFTINEQGLVEEPHVIEATPKGIFNNSALQAILRWKFKPKIENGKTVKRKATQELIFEPKK